MAGTATIPYSASRVDLFFPCNRGNFFPVRPPQSDAALCAEMSRLAYCRQAQDNFALDRTKINAALATVGFAVPANRFFESSVHPQGRGTHCFLAFNAATQTAVAAFRGTDKDDPTDLTDDANFTLQDWPQGGHVHRGFAGALAEITPDLTLPGSGWRLLITGHSLGAALATLLASQHQPTALYTFGSPRVGDTRFVETLQSVDNHRCVDCCDIVTRVPLPVMGYDHVGVPEYIDRNGAITLNPPKETIVQDRFDAVEEFLLKYAFQVGNVGARELADHAPINYVSAVMGLRG